MRNKIRLFNLVLIVVFIFSFTACTAPKIATETTTTETNSTSSETSAAEMPDNSTTTVFDETSSQASGEELKTRFNELKNNAKDLVKILKFLDENIFSADESLADEMIYFTVRTGEKDLEKFTDNYADNDIQITIYDEFEGSTDLNQLKTSKNKKLADLAQETIDRKYKLYNVEGFITPLVDYKAYNSYRQYISKEMNDYMDIMQVESDQPSAVDAGIAIPLEDFIDRIIKSYKFVADYPDSPRAEQINNMKKNKVWIYLAGIDNTAVFEMNGKIYSERLKDFQDTQKKYESTEFGNLLKDYLDLLKQENYQRTQKISYYLENLYNSFQKSSN